MYYKNFLKWCFWTSVYKRGEQNNIRNKNKNKKQKQIQKQNKNKNKTKQKQKSKAKQKHAHTHMHIHTPPPTHIHTPPTPHPHTPSHTPPHTHTNQKKRKTKQNKTKPIAGIVETRFDVTSQNKITFTTSMRHVWITLSHGHYYTLCVI